MCRMCEMQINDVQVRVLSENEHGETRGLWERVFPEDSAQFLDYYYSVRTATNRIYVAQKGRDILAMLHLNPYLLRIGGGLCRTNYIVAVATEESWRHRGLMSALLKRSMRDMYEQRQPFTFLMPADEAIYTPFDYRFIYRQCRSVIGKMTVPATDLLLRPAGKEDARALAEFADPLLAGRYQVYAARDAHYYEVALAEQESENGGIMLAERNGELVGCFFWSDEDGVEVREPLLSAACDGTVSELIGGWAPGQSVPCIGCEEGEEERPVIMARLLHLPTFFACVEAREPLRLVLAVEDRILAENNRTFLLESNGGSVSIVETEEEEQGRIAIADLTSFLFGYLTLEEIEEREKTAFSDRMKRELGKIRPLSDVFLNEIV